MADLTTIRNVLEHVCSKQYECDRHFAHTHIKWFVEENYTQLQTTINPLIVHKTNKPSKIIVFNKSKLEVIIVFTVMISYSSLFTSNNK